MTEFINCLDDCNTSISREDMVNQMDKINTLEKAARIELLVVRGFEYNLDSKGVAAIPSTKNIEKYLDQLARIHYVGSELINKLKRLNGTA